MTWYIPIFEFLNPLQYPLIIRVTLCFCFFPLYPHSFQSHLYQNSSKLISPSMAGLRIARPLRSRMTQIWPWLDLNPPIRAEELLLSDFLKASCVAKSSSSMPRKFCCSAFNSWGDNNSPCFWWDAKNTWWARYMYISVYIYVYMALYG